MAEVEACAGTVEYGACVDAAVDVANSTGTRIATPLMLDIV